MAEPFAELINHLREVHDLKGALSLLHWDQETQLPSGATAGRARQIGALAAVVHQRETEPRFLELVDALAAQLDQLEFGQQVDVRETKWRIDRKRRLDTALVRERATLRSEAHAVWVNARSNNDFTALRPYLDRLIAIERRVAAAIDSGRPAYDVLLEGFEPGASSALLAQVFNTLRDGLLPLIARLNQRCERRPVDGRGLCGAFGLSAQRRFNRMVAERIGFDFARGRLDESAHPFTTEVGDDVRITTRLSKSDLRYGLFSTLHEVGHALYEQGLDATARGTPRATACSMGMHESQSRLWENLVGRSEAFWRWLLPLAVQAFPELRPRRPRAVLLAANEARPSLIRTEADELTYNLHIILRFELEQALIAGELAAADLPAAWEEKMRHFLGVTPASDRDGVLQDVHWAEGLFGYFPTYALGNLYAAQLYEAAQRDFGRLEEGFAAGDFGTLRTWLGERVQRHGQSWRAPELVRRVTGSAPEARPLLAHLTRKLEWLEAN
ncbi:MAG: carboxypeptidase M32 [Deltaproteobacteria bacterium]|nr:carboxypeptidase M32 [Deltaproteobacteria bacterium]